MKKTFVDLNDAVDYAVNNDPESFTYTLTKGKIRNVQQNRALWAMHKSMSSYTGVSQDETHWQWKHDYLIPYLDTRYPEMNLRVVAELAAKDESYIETWDRQIPSTLYYLVRDTIRSRELDREEFSELLQEYDYQLATKGLK